MPVSPYSVFILQTAKIRTLKGLSFEERGKTIGLLYKALTVSKKAVLVQIAQATPSFGKRYGKPQQCVSPYTLYIRRTSKSKSLKGLSFAERCKEVAKRYRALTASQKAYLNRQAKGTGRRLPKADKGQKISNVYVSVAPNEKHRK